MQLTGESLEQQIAETYARHQAEPQNVDLARRLGALHEQKEDFEDAIAWYQYAADLTNRSDRGPDAESLRSENEAARSGRSREHEEFLGRTGRTTQNTPEKWLHLKRREETAGGNLDRRCAQAARPESNRPAVALRVGRAC